MIRPLLISLAFLATPAAAYDVNARMAAAWNSFKTLCPEALFAPQTFIDGTPNPGPAGITTIASSPDGQMVEARRFSETQMLTLRVAGLQTLRLLTCNVHDQGFNAAEIDMGLTRNPGPWLAAFDSIVRPDSTEAIVGGQLPVGFVARGMAQEVIAQNDTLTHHFLTTFTWKGEEILGRMIVGPFNIMFSAERVERPE